MTAPRTPAAKRPGTAPGVQPLIALYLILAAIPAALWHIEGNPVTATARYLNADQAHLVWNTLLTDPAGDAPAAAVCAIDLLWIAWLPFALAAALQLLATGLRLPHTLIPRMLLRLTPSAVVSIVVTGTAAAAQAPAGTVHAGALHHHRLDLEARRSGGACTASALETGIRQAIADTAYRLHPPREAETTVQAGQSLWAIAEDEYGTGTDWPAIYQHNQGQPQPDGNTLTNPDILEPGWKLTLPDTGPSSAPAPPSRAVTPDPPSPDGSAAAPAPGGRAHTDPAPPTAAPIAPETPIPGPTGAAPATAARNRPVPPANAPARGGRSATPAAPVGRGPRTDAPWTTGIDLPDGGYIGVSLLMALAAALLAIRRRRTRRTDQGSGLPQSATRLAITAARAEMAAAGDWDPDLETDPTPPPLLRTRPQHLVFGTTPTGSDEAVLEPAHHPLTVYTGPGAHQAAAALALSALATVPPHRLIIPEPLARHLLGDSVSADDPDWLALTPDTPAALATVAESIEACDARTLVIAVAESAGTFQISAALAADKQRNLAIVLVGDPGHLAAHALTHLDIDPDGHPVKITGPRAATFTGTRLHTLPQTTAAELYSILRHDRTGRATARARVPAQARGTHEHAADGQPAPDPADEDDRPAQTPTPTADTGPSTAASPEDRSTDAAPPPARLLLRVLGPLTYENTTGDTRPGPTGRNAQLLTYLALHPRGRTLHQITDAVWNTDKPAGANRTLVRLRRHLTAAITELTPELAAHAGPALQPVVRELHGTYHLNHQLIHTDHADFTRLETDAHREKNPERRARLAEAALALADGDLAEGVPEHDQRWLTPARDDLNTRLTALAQLTEAKDDVAHNDPIP